MKKMYFLLLLALFCKPLSGFGQQTITLITPYDKDTIETIYPVFSWYYLDPSGTRDDVRYVFTLVDLNNDQSAQAGVTVNSPLIRIEGIQGFQFAYPFDAPELQYNHRYGWRLQRKINGVITSESEAWEFILYKPIKEPYKYATLSTSPDASVYEASEGRLFFKLDERYKYSDTKFYIYDAKNNIITAQLYEDTPDEKKQTVNVIKTGSNYFELDVRSSSPGYYKLVVINTKGIKYQLNFLVK